MKTSSRLAAIAGEVAIAGAVLGGATSAAAAAAPTSRQDQHVATVSDGSCTANATETCFNVNVFEGVPQYHSNNYYWSGAIDSRYGITSSGQSGLLHTHYELALS